MVTFGYAILYVSDVPRAIDFYVKSFGFTAKFITPEADYGELNTGQTTIAFASKALAHTNLKDGFLESNPQQKPFAVELALVTDAVDQVVRQAKANGAIVLVTPEEKPWGQTVAYVRDLDGFLIEICTPMEPS